jgi:hypothetical protein
LFKASPKFFTDVNTSLFQLINYYSTKHVRNERHSCTVQIS